MRTVYFVYAVVAIGDYFDWVSGYSEEEIEERAKGEGFEILEWCGTEEACARSINARIADLGKGIF